VTYLSDVEEKLIRTTVKGLSRVIILWLISQNKMSGYSIIEEIHRLTNFKFTSGIIYPLLYELEEKGLIKGEWVQKGRRNIKYYSITEKGRSILNKLRELFDKPLRQVIESLLI
jgi:PadR family transcriptional regulator PadR